MLLKYIFIISALSLAFMLSVFKIFIQKRARDGKYSGYLNIMIFSFALYILSAFLLIFSAGSAENKAAAAVFAVSPFIIGRFASYKTETLFSAVQVLCAALSAFYVFCLV